MRKLLFFITFLICFSYANKAFAQNNSSFVEPSKYVAIVSGACDLDDFEYGYNDKFKDDSNYNEQYEIYKVLCNSKLTMAERGKSLINHLSFFKNVFSGAIYEDDGLNYIKFGELAGKSVPISWSLDTNGDETITSSIIGSGLVNGSKYWILSHPDSYFPIVVGEAAGLVGKETKGCDYYVFIPRSNIVFLYMIAKSYSQTTFINGHE